MLNNLPVFFIRDAIKFPDLVHALKGEPVSNIPGDSSANSRFWDYMSLTPESTHMLIWLFSDLGTIKSYKFIQSFGVNTYKWVNAKWKAILINGANYLELPINCPKVLVNNNKQDGLMQIMPNHGSANY